MDAKERFNGMSEKISFREGRLLIPREEMFVMAESPEKQPSAEHDSAKNNFGELITFTSSPAVSMAVCVSKSI